MNNNISPLPAPKPEGEPVQLTAQEIQAIHQHLRMLRHAVNNHVAVIMAMAELSQRHPGQGERFCSMCLEKGPQIVSALRRFSDSIETTLHIEPNNDANH